MKFDNFRNVKTCTIEKSKINTESALQILGRHPLGWLRRLRSGCRPAALLESDAVGCQFGLCLGMRAGVGAFDLIQNRDFGLINMILSRIS